MYKSSEIIFIAAAIREYLKDHNFFLHNSIIVNYYFINSIAPEKPHRGGAIKYVCMYLNCGEGYEDIIDHPNTDCDNLYDVNYLCTHY